MDARCCGHLTGSIDFSNDPQDAGLWRLPEMAADDWIAMRKCLADEPATIGIAARLEMDVDTVVGKLHRVWSWADSRTSNGRITGTTFAHIDVVARAQGFASAMEFERWLSRGDDGSVTFPRFAKHNPKSAKKRALDAARQAKKRHRDKRDASRSCHAEVRDCHAATPHHTTPQDITEQERTKPVLSTLSENISSPSPAHPAPPAKARGGADARWGDVEWTGKGEDDVSAILSELGVWAEVIRDIEAWELPLLLADLRSIVTEMVNEERTGRKPVNNHAAVLTTRLYASRGLPTPRFQRAKGTDAEGLLEIQRQKRRGA